MCIKRRGDGTTTGLSLKSRFPSEQHETSIGQVAYPNPSPVDETIQEPMDWKGDNRKARDTSSTGDLFGFADVTERWCERERFQLDVLELWF